MVPQYQFNLQADPLFTSAVPSNYASAIDEQIRQLEAYKQKMQETTLPNKQVQQVTLFDEIDKEVSSLTNEQKEMLAKDKDYATNEYKIQSLIQQELINLVKGRIENIPAGKELLEKQLRLVKDKKSLIIEESNKELELFKKFQIAAQANPNLSYAEFLKQFNK